MKKLIIIFVSIIFLLLATAIILPFAFKGKIMEVALQKANETVDARIEYEKFSLTLLRSFPDFNASFTNLSIVGAGNFEGDTLFAVGNLSARIDIMSVFNSEALKVKSIQIENALLQLIEKENKNYNWTIEKPDTLNIASTPHDTRVENNENSNIREPLKVLLESITVSNFDFIYISHHSNYNFSVFDIDGSLNGTMLGLQTLLDVKAQTPSLNYTYHDIKYISNGKIDLHTQLEADLESYNFIFKQGASELNGLPMIIEGGFAMPGDSMLFDINFDVYSMDMESALGLIPEEFAKYLADIETDGDVAFNGLIEGIYYKTEYPAIEINFDISKGTVKYPQLPDELKVHKLKASISKPQGELDLLKAGISQFDMQLADNPFSMHAQFSNLFSDPLLDIMLDGIIDLSSLSRVIPLGNTKMKGLLTADATIKGNYSSLNKNDFDSFYSAGNIKLKDFFIQNSNIPQGVNISNAALVLKNQHIQIEGLNGTLGQSDFSISGNLDNFVKYMMTDELLIGSFRLESRLLNVNEFMTAYIPDADTLVNEQYVRTDTSAVNQKPLELPSNLHLTFNASVSRLLYDNMNITNFKGNLELKEQQLILTNLNMNLLEGKMGLSGTVLANGKKQPQANLNLNIANFDLPAAHAQLSMVQRYLPFASQSTGTFSTRLNLKSTIDKNLKMLLSGLTASGTFSSRNLSLIDASLLSNLNQVIQINKLRNLDIDNFTTAFAIENGNLNISPFSTKVANQPVKIDGTYNLGGTINMNVETTVDKDILSPHIIQYIEYIPGHQNIKTIDVGISIKGDAKKPDISVDNDKIRQQVINQVRNSSQQDIEDAARKLLRDLFR